MCILLFYVTVNGGVAMWKCVILSNRGVMHCGLHHQNRSAELGTKLENRGNVGKYSMHDMILLRSGKTSQFCIQHLEAAQHLAYGECQDFIL